MTTNLTDLSALKDHPTYCLGDQIKEICRPLFNNFSINYFSYVQVYIENNEIKSLAVTNSNKILVFDYMQSSYKFIFNGKKLHTWVSTHDPQAQKEMGTNLSLYNVILIEKVHSYHIETLEFASPTPYTSPLEFCSNKELLNQFLMYFKDKARGILKTIEKEPLYFPQSRFSKLENPDQPYEDFCQATRIKKLPLKFKSQEIIFTRREFEVLSLLIKGKGMREIGKILKISPRTVESYLYNAKDKTNTFTISQLLQCFKDSLF
jgi:DNA-binding CsgD family transcriptional regulator